MYYAYMVIRKNEGAAASVRKKPGGSRRIRSGGPRVYLWLGSDPIAEVQNLNQQGLKSMTNCRIEEVMQRVHVLVNNLPCDSSTNSSMLNSRRSRRLKKSKSLYIPVLIVGPFSSEDDAFRFREIWNRKTRGMIPRAAVGVELAKMFDVPAYGDLKTVFDGGERFYEVRYDGSEEEWIMAEKNFGDSPSLIVQ